MRNSFAVYASQFLNRRSDDRDGDGEGDSHKDGNGDDEDEDGDGESRMFYSFATLEGEGGGEGGGSGWDRRDRWNGVGEGDREREELELELELEGGSGWLTGQFQETLTEPLLPPQPRPRPPPQRPPQRQPIANRIQSKMIKMISVISFWVWIGGVCMTFTGVGVVGIPFLLTLIGIWSTSFPSFLFLSLLIPLSILVVYRLSTLSLLFTNLKNQQNLLQLTRELSLYDVPLLLVLAPLGVVLGLVGSVPFGWVLWNVGVGVGVGHGHGHPVLGLGIGVVWVWSWGVLRGLIGVIGAWVVGRWYHTNNTKSLLQCLYSSLPTITLHSLILSSTQILTFLINLLNLFSSFSSWFSPSSYFSPWFSSSILVWCLHRITARFNPYTIVYIGFTGVNPNHSLSIPHRPINKVSSPLPLPLAFILAFALIIYSPSPSPSPSPTLLTLTLTSTLVSSFCTSLVNDIGDALWVCWVLEGVEGDVVEVEEGLGLGLGLGLAGRGRREREQKRKRVRDVFGYSSPHPRHSLPSPNSLDSPNSVDSVDSVDSDSISVIVHSRTRGTQTHRSSRNVDTDVINTIDRDTMDEVDEVDMDMGMGTGMDMIAEEVSGTDETDLDPFVPGV